MLSAFALAIRQLGDPRLLAIFAQSFVATLAVFVLVGGGIWYGLERTLGTSGGVVSGLAAAALTLVLLWLAFRAVAIAVLGLFGDQVVQAVERRFYPAAARTARPVAFVRALTMGATSVMRVLLYNFLAVPLYLVLLATGVGAPLLFFALNGWLLGRDLGDMVAARHLTADALPAWRHATRWQRLGTGLLTSGLFVVPVVNVIAPVVGAAMMTHLFHRRHA